MVDVLRNFSRRTWMYCGFFCIVSAGFYGAYRPLPDEVGMHGTTYSLEDGAVTFLADTTFLTPEGMRVMEQTIFDEVFKMIESAEHFILVDMFLWNSFQGAKAEQHRALSDELARALVEKKRDNPDITIVVVSDPINTVYEGQKAPEFEMLREAGVPVVLTELGKLRDSNPVYSMFWRALLQWPDKLHNSIIGSPYTFRWLPNIMNSGGEKVTLRSYLTLFNFKANHRKLIVTDATVKGKTTISTLVTSANPHNGSSAHGNVALRVDGGLWRDVLLSEKAVFDMAGFVFPSLDTSFVTDDTTGRVQVALRTEKAILSKALNMLRKVGTDDTVELAMFYLSESKIITELIEASRRGANVRIILDANKDAFGIEKNGVPNRPVAYKLIRESGGKIELRWCATHGEQCHTKLLIISYDGGHELLLGSANYTRKNLRNFNLETNVWVHSEAPSTAWQDASLYFETIWSNEGDKLFTTEYETYRDESHLKRLQSWWMERTGMSTF